MSTLPSKLIFSLSALTLFKWSLEVVMNREYSNFNGDRKMHKMLEKSSVLVSVC